MTEIPEHLLQRSRERRAALGLGGDDAGAAAAPAASAASDAGGEVTPAAPSAPAPRPKATPLEPVVKEPEPVPHYVEASQRRRRIPVWAIPIIAGIIAWAPIYVGTLQTPVDEGGPLAAGADLYVSAQCAGCHGNAGQGGVGRPLAGGEVVLTFPEWQGHYEYVLLGSSEFTGPIGDPDRPGGAHIAGDFGNMPGFGETLSTVELLEVVLYERVTHGGADMESEDILSLIEAIEAAEAGEEIDLAAAEG